MTDKIQIYRSRGLSGRLQWRWRWVASNGKKLATSGEAYHNLDELLPALGRVTGLPVHGLRNRPWESVPIRDVHTGRGVQIEFLSHRPRRMSA